ncbi:MAG TPA: pilus assembly protein CpaE [candidate division Zixibacteria bacterium]|nr:pilus assembly protein CpaE [candidate division Zixibacteria bacterium]
MISLPLALELMESGLAWEPKLHDFFTIPNTSLEKRIFVVNDMMIDVQQLFGLQMITFNGAVEWSLDYITIAEALWVPTESQLREKLLQHAQRLTIPHVTLTAAIDDCSCKLMFRGSQMSFVGADASDAYAQALLYLLAQ